MIRIHCGNPDTEATEERTQIQLQPLSHLPKVLRLSSYEHFIFTKPSIETNAGYFFIVLLLLFIVGYLYSLFSELSMLARVHEQGALIKIRTSIPPLLIMMPALAVLIRGIMCRLRHPVSESAQKKGLYFIIASFPAFLLVWGVYSWQLGNWFDENGYTECAWYSGATLGAPKIMLSDPGYCVKQGYPIRIELIDWFETQYNSGVNPSLAAFTQKQQQLLADYKKRFEPL